MIRTKYKLFVFSIEVYKNVSIQKFFFPKCLGHSWYLSVDVQLHILSPLILFWVLNKERTVAWSALIFAMLGILIAATAYNFMKELPSSTFMPT